MERLTGPKVVAEGLEAPRCSCSASP